MDGRKRLVIKLHVGLIWLDVMYVATSVITLFWTDVVLLITVVSVLNKLRLLDG